MNEITNIIEPDAQHIPAMHNIFMSAQMLHHEAFPDVFCKPDNHEDIAAYLRSYMKPRNPLRKRRKFASACLLEDELQGYVLYQLFKSSDVFFGKERWMCYIDDIAVDPNSRKAGIASKLIEQLLEGHLKDLDNCMISAQVWRANEASQGLFRKYQFNNLSNNFYRLL